VLCKPPDHRHQPPSSTQPTPLRSVCDTVGYALPPSGLDSVESMEGAIGGLKRHLGCT